MNHNLELWSSGTDVLILKSLLELIPELSYKSDKRDVFDGSLQLSVNRLQTILQLRNRSGKVDREIWQTLGKRIPDDALRRLTAPSPGLYEVTKGSSIKNFVVVYGEPGVDGNNAGKLFALAARTHVKEVITRQFPGIPTFDAASKVNDPGTLVTRVRTLVDALDVPNIAYLAYFGHSSESALYAGDAAAFDTNLSNNGGSWDTPLSVLPKGNFLANAQVRLFGCRAGHGSNSIAQQMASYLEVSVFAYPNSGGSIFTHDRDLGYGKRQTRQSDIDFTNFSHSRDIWLIPINGRPVFAKF